MNRITVLTLVAVVICCQSGWCAADETAVPTVRTKSGVISGVQTSDGSVLFRSVPFAAPPVGVLRWRAPQPVVAWHGVRDATHAAPACAQSDIGWNKSDLRAGISEDCLYLDVRTPSLTPSKLLPVMVWIHGGGNEAGRGTWAALGTIHQRGIVLVALQYRLGALGFMAHPALSSEQGGHSGNYALMDEQAALRWVRDNIARFGGDPHNVTLFGNSVGAQHVALQMQSPAAHGLFQKAIAQSGWSNFGWPTRTLATAEQQGQLIAQAAGLSAAATAKQLRGLSVETLLAAQMKAAVAEFGLPVVDGHVLAQDPRDVLARDQAVTVPLIIGGNAREEPLSGGSNAIHSTIAQAFGKHVSEALAFYGLDQSTEPAPDARLGDVATQLSADISYRCPLIAVLQSARRAHVPVWQYQFDHVAPDGASVVHAAEIRYVFAFERNVDTDQAPMQRYWTNFAMTGSPNGSVNAEDLPHWPAYELDSRSYLEFAQSGPVVRAQLREPLCDWRKLP